LFLDLFPRVLKQTLLHWPRTMVGCMVCKREFYCRRKVISAFAIRDILVKHAFTVSVYNVSQCYHKSPSQCLIYMEISKLGHARDREGSPCYICYRCYAFQLLELFASVSLTFRWCTTDLLS
jgi:hypothetical protein